MTVESPPVAGPTKVCPHCGTMSQTTAKKCPNCGKGYKKRTALKVFLGICLLGLVGIVGCAALIGGAANEVSKQLDAEQKAHAITRAQYDSLKIGMSESAVTAKLGKDPENKQEFESKSFVGDEPSNSSCIYYNKSGGSFGDVYQLCFTEGKLDAKNSY